MFVTIEAYVMLDFDGEFVVGASVEDCANVAVGVLQGQTRVFRLSALVAAPQISVEDVRPNVEVEA